MISDLLVIRDFSAENIDDILCFCQKRGDKIVKLPKMVRSGKMQKFLIIRYWLLRF